MIQYEVAVGFVVCFQAYHELVAFVVQADDSVLGALRSYIGIAAGGVVFGRVGKLVVDAPGEACICVFGDLVARRYARVYGKLVVEIVMVGTCAEIDDDAAGRFKVDFKVGTRTPGTVGCVEFKDLCLRDRIYRLEECCLRIGCPCARFRRRGARTRMR